VQPQVGEALSSTRVKAASIERKSDVWHRPLRIAFDSGPKDAEATGSVLAVERAGRCGRCCELGSIRASLPLKARLATCP
jgi:hypothetical protein